MTVTTEPATRVVHTACTLDCPDGCSLEVTVTDGRITRVDASAESRFTDGWICAKVKRSAERVYAPERVTTPLLRVGPKGAGAFRAATWDEALELVAARMRGAIAERGPDAVVAFTYNSSAAVVERASMTEAFFAAIGATFVEHTICAHTMGESWASVFGAMNSADPRDVENSRYVVVWGANPTVSNTHWPPLVHAAQKAGATVVVVDPRRTAMAARADLHLAPLPGTDAVLAHAIANRWSTTGALDRAFADAHATGVDEFLAESAEWTLDRAAAVCGVASADIARLADGWATIRPAMLRIGWGQERNANGGAACRAVLALPVLGAHFGVPGGGVIGSFSAGAAAPRRRWPQEARSGAPRRVLPMHQLGRWMAPLSDDPCAVLFVQGANPRVSCPDSAAVDAALRRDDVFTVVHDQVLTDTTRYADVVLPATTSFEIDDVNGSYGTVHVHPVRQVIAPIGESRSNDNTGLALARAWGFGWTPDPPIAAAADPGPRDATLAMCQFVDTFPDDDRGRRARLADPVQGVPRYVPIEHDASAFPLVLISPASPKLVNSVFGEFQSPSPSVAMHPDDAATRGITSGQPVRVTSAVGSIDVPADVRSDMRPGVVSMWKGVWLRHYDGGWGVNTLTPATGDPLANGACFNDAFVEIRPL